MKKFYYLLIIICLFLFIPLYSFADTYIIKRGDTPNKIAKKFNVDVDKLIKINKLNPKKLKLGKKITIPKSNTSKLENNIIDKKFAKKSNVAKDQTNITTRENREHHTVKKGETLYTIAKKYSMTIDEIKRLNNLHSARLKIGQKLTIKKTSPSFYIVQKGDTIYRIAKRFNMNIEDLKLINGLESNRLKTGQKLILEQKFAKDENKINQPVISTNYNIEEPIIDTYTNIDSEDKNLSTKEKLVLFSKKLLNLPYRFGGNSPFGIDCSAFVQKVYKFIGIDLPRSAREQYVEGIPVDRDELSVGDLVFFKTYASFPSHVGIYLGNNLFIHASSRSRKVTIDSLDTPYYFKRYIGAKRILESEKNFDLDTEG